MRNEEWEMKDCRIRMLFYVGVDIVALAWFFVFVFMP